MKRRITIFGLVWAFTFNALWVPGGLDGGYMVSVCFPAWPLFLLGLAIGSFHEGLSSRWPRIGVALATIVTLTQLCLLLFGGHTAGFSLALPMAAATGLASCAAAQPWLTRLRAVPILGGMLVGMAACALLGTVIGIGNWRSSTIKETHSRNGIFSAQVRETMGMKTRNPNHTIVVGPRRDITHWFWAPVGDGFNATWIGNQTLHISRYERPHRSERYLNIQTSHNF